MTSRGPGCPHRVAETWPGAPASGAPHGGGGRGSALGLSRHRDWRGSRCLPAPSALLRAWAWQGQQGLRGPLGPSWAPSPPSIGLCCPRRGWTEPGRGRRGRPGGVRPGTPACEPPQEERMEHGAGDELPVDLPHAGRGARGQDGRPASHQVRRTCPVRLEGRPPGPPELPAPEWGQAPKGTGLAESTGSVLPAWGPSLPSPAPPTPAWYIVPCARRPPQRSRTPGAENRPRTHSSQGGRPGGQRARESCTSCSPPPCPGPPWRPRTRLLPVLVPSRSPWARLPNTALRPLPSRIQAGTLPAGMASSSAWGPPAAAQWSGSLWR